MTATLLLFPGDPGDRQGHLGATDIAALVCARDGIATFAGAGAWKTWASQLHPELIAAPSPETLARWALGHHLEPYVLHRLETESEGLTVAPGGYVHSPAHPHIRAQLDGLALVDGAIVGPADAKTTEIPWEWYSWEREDGQWSRVEILPAGYVVQARIQLGLLRMACAVQGLPLPTQAVYVGLDLTGAPMVPDGDGVRLDLDRAPLMVRWVDHNEDLFRDQYWYAVRWWDRYILGDEEPPDDDSDCCQRWRLYEQAHGYGERPATPEESALIAEWLALKEANKTNEAERKTLQARILAGMDTPRLTLAGKQRVQLQLTGRNMTLRDYGF